MTLSVNRFSETINKYSLSGVTIDELVHMTGQVPDEVTVADKSVSERINLVQQLEEEDKQAVFRIIDSMLTKSKFKDFFNKNVASL